MTWRATSAYSPCHELRLLTRFLLAPRQRLRQLCLLRCQSAIVLLRLGPSEHCSPRHPMQFKPSSLELDSTLLRTCSGQIRQNPCHLSWMALYDVVAGNIRQTLVS